VPTQCEWHVMCCPLVYAETRTRVRTLLH